MAINTYNFSTDYQDELLATMMRQPELFIGLDSVIDFSYFTGPNSQIVCKEMMGFYKKHMTFPTPAQLGNLVINYARSKGNNESAEELKLYVQKLSEISVRAPQSYRDEAVRFAKTRACIIAATEVAKTIQENKELTYDIPKRFQDALAIGQNIYDVGYRADLDADYVINKLQSADYGIYTGFDLLDNEIWKKGWGPGWLIVPLAPPKRYKTAFCLNLALNMVSPALGYDVIYYACEISSELALLRAYQRIANRTHDDFWEDPEDFTQALKKGLGMKVAGSLWVKHFPSKTATISDIRAHAMQLIQSTGIKPKAIFIDYAETIKPDGDKDAPEHRQQSGIYTAARAMGDELGCAIIMPDRCNRETVSQAVPDMDGFQGAFEKAGIVDVGIGLCATPEEYLQHKLRFFVFLNRHGEAGVHMRGKVDPERMIITMDEVLSWQETQNLQEKMDEERAKKKGIKQRGGRNKEAALDERLGDPGPADVPRASNQKKPRYEV